MGRAQAATFGLVLVAVLIGAGLGYSKTPVPATPSSDTAGSVPESGVMVVYVSGWVAMPGVVEVAEGSIVADAVAAAGGALEGALLEAINLASPVSGGDHIQIPGPGDSVAVGGGGGGEGLIPVNQAEASDLEELPGVGPVLAERIVAHREANGPFETVEDLLEVPGIGEAKLASIRDLVTVP